MSTGSLPSWIPKLQCSNGREQFGGTGSGCARPGTDHKEAGTAAKAQRRGARAHRGSPEGPVGQVKEGFGQAAGEVDEEDSCQERQEKQSQRKPQNTCKSGDNHFRGYSLTQKRRWAEGRGTECASHFRYVAGMSSTRNRLRTQRPSWLDEYLPRMPEACHAW
jgi:hypothetical protein